MPSLLCDLFGITWLMSFTNLCVCSLHLLCECNEQGHWHFTNHPGVAVSRPRDFIMAAAPYLKLLIRTMSLACRVGELLLLLLLLRSNWRLADTKAVAVCMCAGIVFGLPLPGLGGAPGESDALNAMGTLFSTSVQWTALQLDEYWFMKPEEDWHATYQAAKAYVHALAAHPVWQGQH